MIHDESNMNEKKESVELKDQNLHTAKLINEIDNLSVKDLLDLVNQLSEKYGISANAMPTTSMGGKETETSGKNEAEYSVKITAIGKDKDGKDISVISAVKLLKEFVKAPDGKSDLNLLEGKKMLDAVASSPIEVEKKTSKANADALKEKLTAAGFVASIEVATA